MQIMSHFARIIRKLENGGIEIVIRETKEKVALCWQRQFEKSCESEEFRMVLLGSPGAGKWRWDRRLCG